MEKISWVYRHSNKCSSSAESGRKPEYFKRRATGKAQMDWTHFIGINLCYVTQSKGEMRMVKQQEEENGYKYQQDLRRLE